MKFCIPLIAGMALLSFTGCGGSTGMSSTPSPPPAIHNEWTWMTGANVVNQMGRYGTQGTAYSINTPGARSYAVTWTDASGNLWLFGGYGIAGTFSEGDLNDLWKYSDGQWTWVGGSNATEQAGSYGNRGVPSPSNYPGARYQGVSWTDSSGNLWLFGGLGIDSTGNRGDLNDLWRYNNGEWTWMSGSEIAAEAGINYPAGVYGTEGIAASGNTPGARYDASSWTDAAGNLWLFGGEGSDSIGTLGILNDLWKYSGGKWTWISGSNHVNQFGAYGTKGVAAPGNVPGARTNPITWTDASGNLWLFGGQGNDSNGCKSAPAGPCILNDLWKYNSTNNTWTWVSGSNIVNEPGVYGTEGTAASGNIPGARQDAVSWIDAVGNLWLFGGYGFDSTPSLGVFGDLNDLWKYSPATNSWTWVNGATKAAQMGTYGTQGVAALANIPGSRDSAVGWADRSGNLWLFGGGNYLSIANGGKFNDLWEYQP